MDKDSIIKHNRNAWNREVQLGNKACIPVSKNVIENAKSGKIKLSLTPNKEIPRNWFPESLLNIRVLCLAAGGGQHAPIFSSAGAIVTLLDNSPKQLEQDLSVAIENNLEIKSILGDMTNLSCFGNNSFDLIVLPLSNQFIPNPQLVWDESYRVLCKGGILIAAFMNPQTYTFDHEKKKDGLCELKYPIPYSDLTSISEDERCEFYGKEEPIEFGHSLDSQIGGQLTTGFHMVGFYSDRSDKDISSVFIPTYYVTKSIK